MRATAVSLDRLTKRYHRHIAVDGVSLTVAPGEMVALLGPSGCGKTTCLRMVAGLTVPTSGEIRLDGRPITNVDVHRRNIGVLFQSYALFPHMTVAENVAFGLEMRRVGTAELRRRVQDALDLVQLSAMAGRLPQQLSGGQQQRVALARALVIEPDVLLLDEPLGALDKGLREEMQAELRSLQRRLGVTTIMVTHDQDEALTMADQVVVMRNGRLEQTGAPAQVYSRPANLFVAQFLGVSNVFVGRTETRDGVCGIMTDTGLHVSADGPPPAGGSGTVTVRPEAVTLAPLGGPVLGPNATAAVVQSIVYRGPVSHYRLQTDAGTTLIAFRQNDGEGLTGIAVGQRVMASWTTRSAHLLPEDTSSSCSPI